MRLESDLPADLEKLISDVIGAAIEVHRHLGPGFLENIYEQALAFELLSRGISFERQKEIVVPYKENTLIGQRLDLLVDSCLILELKAVEQILPIHEAQLHSYLKALSIRAGLILNFNVKQMKSGIKRIIK